MFESKSRKNKQEMAQDKKSLPVKYIPNYMEGLSKEQVEDRISAGLCNEQPAGLTRSIPQIVRGNVFTLFNLLNLILATIILLMGDWKNALFIGVAVCNTGIGIFQEIRSKKTIDKLSIVAQSKVNVVRNGERQFIEQDQVVLDDIIVVETGNQIVADGTVRHSQGLEVDESLLTGESDHIKKGEQTSVLSGSFVTAGTAYIQVDAVGQDGYAAQLAKEAKTEKQKNSKIMQTLNIIIRVLTIVIVPVGVLLFYTRYRHGTPLNTAVLGATAAMIGMIPEGLMLLTSVTFAVGSVNLAKHKTLVQSLPSIETLARVDVLCLDKTGTITDGSMTAEKLLPLNQSTVTECSQILSAMLQVLQDQNPTAKAMRKQFHQCMNWKEVAVVPFSSQRKWSGVTFEEKGSYLMGAPEFIFSQIEPRLQKQIDSFSSQGYRVLCLAHTQESISEESLPQDILPLGLIMLSDNIRKEAPETFRYFKEQGVELKVISGDNPITVSNIAQKAGLYKADRYVDMSQIKEDADYQQLVKNTTVFGRVSPYQKRKLVQALQANGRTVCMTGDGVNDVLALKEADCGVAMVGGSDAARSVADFVLMDSNFSSMVEVLKEGRRVINNIEHVASLYLVKTIYSTLLALLYMFLPFPYPFSPLQLSPINSLTVGIPSFFLALQPNYKKPKGRFASNILENSVPAALTIIFDILIIQLAGHWFHLTHQETATMSVFLTGSIGFLLLIKVSRPFDWKKGVLVSALATVFLSIFLFFRDFFSFSSLFTRNVFFYLPLFLNGYTMFYGINRLVIKAEIFVHRAHVMLRASRRKRVQQRRKKDNL